MTRYAVGDLQGCLTPLQCLLDEVCFDLHNDELWIVGDLINRGPDSLGTMRFIKQLGASARVVLGNHDLHFLAVAFNTTTAGKHDTFSDILDAPDRDEITHWLLQQRLIYTDPSGDYTMVHAGIPPMWDIGQARAYAEEVQVVLKSTNAVDYFDNMYGDKPNSWSDNLSGYTRLRVITNYFTRMRFCTTDGVLDFKNKETKHPDPSFSPWFSFPDRETRNDKILFGHWASLQGVTDTENALALDTGCVWGRSLTLYDLDRRRYHNCSCA
ncbi:MAG: bis(5'-nucleosyl)-tetraphosphatase (symmetrical) [Oceanicoccus sp.]|jgi:bis(5'-nucleosyl)-tetraphosphatase (symmetrical)